MNGQFQLSALSSYEHAQNPPRDCIHSLARKGLISESLTGGSSQTKRFLAHRQSRGLSRSY